MSAKKPANITKSKTYKNDDLDCGKKLYLDTETADVHFLFDSMNGEGDVAAHKNVLAVTSDVFKAMFYGKSKETGNVHMPHASEAAFMEFLQYFYLKKVKLSADHIEAVLHLGRKYNVEKCINDCLQFLDNLINDENVCSHLHLAIRYEQPESMKVCKKRILMNTAAVFKSADFLACDRQTLEYILKMNQFLCSEAEVFEAMMLWVKAKSKQDVLSKELVETHLGNLFYEIRFATMKIEEFCALAEKYDSVLSSYHRTITNMIVLPHLRNEKSGRFNTSPRNAKWNKEAIIKCDREFGDEMAYDLDLFERLIFLTSEPLFLGSLKFAKIVFEDKISGLSDLKTDLMVNMEIGNPNLNFERISTLSKTVEKLKSEKTTIRLQQPILIEPELYYIIKIGPFPESHRFYSSNLKTQMKLESDITIEFQKCTADGQRRVGIISALEFNRI